MPSARRIPQSRSETSVVDKILDAFSRYARENDLIEATAVHIPAEMEKEIDEYYADRCGKTARQMLPTWTGVEAIVWDAAEFKVCSLGRPRRKRPTTPQASPPRRTSGT
jgi:hypothetical protein